MRNKKEACHVAVGFVDFEPHREPNVDEKKPWCVYCGDTLELVGTEVEGEIVPGHQCNRCGKIFLFPKDRRRGRKKNRKAF